MTDERLTLYSAFREIDRLERSKASVERVAAVEEDIRDIRDSTKWMVRTVSSMFFLLIINLVVLWINFGIGGA